LNNSKIVQTEPIYHLTKENKITSDIGIWKGIRNENGQISLQSLVKYNKNIFKFSIKLFLVSIHNKQ
jgi:hypothetical protein